MKPRLCLLFWFYGLRFIMGVKIKAPFILDNEKHHHKVNDNHHDEISQEIMNFLQQYSNFYNSTMNYLDKIILNDKTFFTDDFSLNQFIKDNEYYLNLIANNLSQQLKEQDIINGLQKEKKLYISTMNNLIKVKINEIKKEIEKGNEKYQKDLSIYTNISQTLDELTSSYNNVVEKNKNIIQNEILNVDNLQISLFTNNNTNDKENNTLEHLISQKSELYSFYKDMNQKIKLFNELTLNATKDMEKLLQNKKEKNKILSNELINITIIYQNNYGKIQSLNQTINHLTKTLDDLNAEMIKYKDSINQLNDSINQITLLKYNTQNELKTLKDNLRKKIETYNTILYQTKKLIQQYENRI